MRKRKLEWACAALIILFFSPAIWIGRQDWTPVTATVDSTRIESTRPGTPAWSLLVDFRYAIDQKEYRKPNVEVFHDRERNVTEAERRNWPVGREITAYCSKQNPESLSLEEDGNLEATLVVATLLSFATALVFLPFFVARKRRNTLPASGPESR